MNINQNSILDWVPPIGGSISVEDDKYILTSMIGFTALHQLYSTKFNFNLSMANNFTALTHASLAVIGSGLYLFSPSFDNLDTYDMVKTISSGYFLYDMFYILLYGKRSTLNTLYLYHHFASIYLINHNPLIYRGSHVLFWGELSNLPMYIVYYYIKTEPKNSSKVCLWKNIQAYSYALIRWPVLTYITYDTIITVDNPRPIYVALPVYFMGLLWSINLFQKLPPLFGST